ncbi:MAG: DUF1579 domain-containing protein [Polaromonas sp.]
MGDWTSEAEMAMGPDKPPTKCTGTESVRPLGDLWVLCEGRGEMPGGGMANMLMTLGYDPQKKAFIGSWVGSMMTHMWVYHGALDEAKKVLTLDTEGPSFTGDGKLARYRDTITIKSKDERVLTSHTLQDDGTWKGFMTATYRRVK